MPIDAVVADANVLLSAVAGRAALRVITKYRVAVHVAQFNVREIERYLPLFARRYDIPAEIIEIQWRLLPRTVHPYESYAAQYPLALADLAARDPEDAHALALARNLELPIWSNDLDLGGHGIEAFPTARLLALLEGRKSL